MTPTTAMPGVAGNAPGIQSQHATAANVSGAYRTHDTTKPRNLQVPTLATQLYVPAELESTPQWVAWRYAVVDGRLTKIPVNPRTGFNAKTDTRGTWSDLDTALDYYDKRHDRVSGIGVVLRGTRLAGVDLDHCIDDGIIQPRAMRIVRALNSYTEVSPSGEGLRVFGLGVKPGQRSKSGDVELYDHTSMRFLTFTGRHLPGTPLELRDMTAELADLYRETFPEPAPQPARRAEPAPVDVDDADLLAAAMTAKNGSAFVALWNGDTSSHPSPSEADLALCCHLAFWTGGDADRIDRMFRSSGLMRDKWDERHSGTGATYGAMTIGVALERTTNYYTPRHKPVQSHSAAEAGGVVADVPSIADVWRILNKHVTHDGERCPMCGRLYTEEWEIDDHTHGRYRLFRCKRRDCLDWQTHRAKQLVAQADVHLWPAHYVTKLPVDDYDRMIDRGLLSREAQWRGVLETDDVMFVASGFAINARSIATRLDALAPMLALTWLSRKPGSRLRDPKKMARTKRAAVVACDVPAAEAVTAVVSASAEPEPKPTRRYAFGLVDLDYSQAHDLLEILEHAGATVDHKRGTWSYRTTDRENIAAIIKAWSSVAGVGGRYEINAFKAEKSTNVSISDCPPVVEALVGDMHPDIARLTRYAAARTVTNHGRQSG